MANTDRVVGGIEAGGTKFVLAVGTAAGEISSRHTLPTRDPEKTLREAADWFAGQPPLAALGIGSFGPLDLDPMSPEFGHITSTPKPGWADCDIAGYFREALACPVILDTDVNAAALAEWEARAHDAPVSLAYVTIGTGIGGGIVLDGRIVGGKTHPELGHIRVARHSADREFGGVCPYHGDCLEGLASGPAIAARWGKRLDELDDFEASRIIAYYLGQLCHALFSTTALQHVVLGGGVMQAAGLLEAVSRSFSKLDNGYLPRGVDRIIEAPRLGTASGITGALLLAARAMNDGRA